jgi:4-diphosphocytidyl-2-C-methyl-D-erythritol kinase
VRTLRAYAKVNLTLRVRPRDASGLHPLRSLAQSIDLYDEVGLAAADDEDGLTVEGAEAVEVGEENLVWRAVSAARRHFDVEQPVTAHLLKRIPVAAGLGGGSADAAATLVLAAGLLGGARGDVDELAPGLGADVPFCVVGGTLWMAGHGERLEPAPVEAGYHMAIAVAPFTLATAEVFRRWDEMEGPTGPGVDGGSLPPALREVAPLVNDLVPAARSLRPELGDFEETVRRAWGQPVLMSGSGPSLVGFFPTPDEAAQAAAVIEDARFSTAAATVDRGWDGEPGGTLPPPPWGVV